MNTVHFVNGVHATVSGWDLRRKNRTAEILDAAMTQIVAGGVDNFSINKLGRALGMSPGALYRYFDSKEVLLAALEVQVIDRIHRRLVDAAEAIDLRPDRANVLARLLTIARTYAELSKESDFHLLAYFVGDPRPLVPDAYAAPVMASAGRILGLVAELFTQAVEIGALHTGDPVVRAGAFWASLHGVLQTRKLARVGPAVLDVDRMAEEVPLALLSGWGATDRMLEIATS